MRSNLLFGFILLAITANAQWSTRASLPGIARAKAASFNINDKIFMMGGVNNSNVVLNDFWQYDITSDSWTQKTNFPGAERYGAVSFVLNNFGYIVAGGNDNGYLDDLWEYDPANNFWLQKTGLPVTSPQHDNQRVEAFAFVVGNKAYLGGGSGFVFGANSTNPYAFFDLWEYDPISDNWTQKSDIPDFIGRNMSIAVAINGKGYVGLGCNVDQTINRRTFWEYDPSNDSWTAKADFPNDFTADAGAVVYGSQLYVVGGVNLNPVSLSNQVYQYDPVADIWAQMSPFSGNDIAGEFSVTTPTSAFIGGGYNGSIVPRNDLWEISSAITGINKTDNDDIAVYPNPCSDHLSVKSKNEIATIEIYNSGGQLVVSQRSKESVIVLNNLTDGNYTVRTTLRNGNSFSKSITIEN